MVEFLTTFSQQTGQKAASSQENHRLEHSALLQFAVALGLVSECHIQRDHVS